MKELGKVVKVEDEYLEISIRRTSACDKCKRCISADAQNQMLLRAKPYKNASIGDIVEIEQKTSTFLSAVFTAYIIPLIAFIIGLVIGLMGFADHGQGTRELYSILLGILFLVITYLVISFIDKKYFKKSGKFLPRVKCINSKKGG
ncbi:MAG TPA: SoxR reducing system RseC family protein [Clostridiales bacterium]|nr:SoxR reducing system RseC family protein [Clostridiales bacterium]